MDVNKLYKISLSFPLIVPILFTPLFFIFNRLMNETVAIVFLTIIYSGLVGGIPYLIIAIILFRWMNDKSEMQIRKALLLSPLFMIALFSFGYLFLGVILSNDFFQELKKISMAIIACDVLILIFGYSYVLITFAFVKIFKNKYL